MTFSSFVPFKTAFLLLPTAAMLTGVLQDLSEIPKATLIWIFGGPRV